MDEPTIPLHFLRHAAPVARETGIPLDDITHAATEKMRKTMDKRRAPSGKFRILCVDKYDGTDGYMVIMI